jgi:hypothetical protein
MALKLKDIVKGTTRVINVTFTQQDGTPYDLTGGKVFFAATTVSAPSDDSGAAIDITPITSHTAATLGQSRITLSNTQTNIAAGTYNFGVQAVLSDGTVVEETGSFKVKQDYKIATT